MALPVIRALAEPNRLRIVELLAAAPRSVGEIAGALAIRQPQVTKHLQTLQAAGLVTAYPLGRRRIYALDREPLRQLSAWLESLPEDQDSVDALNLYRAAIAAEDARPAADRSTPREFEFMRVLPVRPSRVWQAWTDANLVRRWWAPTHFEVVECDVDAVPGGAFRVVIAERDGTRHTAVGEFTALNRPHSLSFDLAPLDTRGRRHFAASYDVRLRRHRGDTELRLRITVSNARREAAPVVAGLAIGWEQLLDKLAATLVD